MTESKSSVGAVMRALGDGRSFVLPLHLVPDGDSVGSSLALAEGLRALGKEAVVVSSDVVPPMFSILPESAGIVRLEDWDGQADTVVMLDVSAPDRSGMSQEALSGKTIVNIDHHVSNAGFAHVGYVDSGSASCSELIFQLLTSMGVQITESIATMLYVGIMTDTGSFRHSNTSASCLEIAARLVACGAKPSELARQFYETKSLASLRVTGLALAGLKVSQCGKVSWIVVTREMLAEAGATYDDGEGIVNYARMIPGVEVALALRETDAGVVRAGLRSKDWLDVSKVAANFGGGGHARASGFTYPGPLHEALRVLTEHLSSLVKEKR